MLLSFAKSSMDFLVCCQHQFCLSIFEWFDQNTVAVVVVANHDVVVAITLWTNESTDLVGMNLTSGFHSNCRLKYFS
jgi:hypothetical protein